MPPQYSAPHCTKPYLGSQIAEAAVFEATQHVVCVAHAVQHVVARAALACAVRRRDANAALKAQLPSEMLSGHTQLMSKRQQLKVG